VNRHRVNRQLVIMGVSGSGKSTVAALIASRTGCVLAEGDDFHPAASIARMAAGCPLDDTLRAPWLVAIAAWLTERAARGECAVVSCSALTRAYRDVLRGAGPGVWIVHLAGPYELVEQRLAARRGHFMPRELLASQYATLEPLAADEPGLTVDLAGTPQKTPEKIADEVLRTLPWPPRVVPCRLDESLDGSGERC
jgi:gluconokinase